MLLVIACVSLCLIVGCATSSRQKSVAKLIQARNGALACLLYADAHGGQYPPNLSAAAGYADTNFLNQLTASFDLVYSGASTNIAKPYATIILKEKQAWRSAGGDKLRKAYGFADGHAEIYKSEDGTFDKWEAEHIIKP